MGLWPFGREPEDVESISRVVTALARDARRVRGKLTLHFKEPQTQTAADAAADRCAEATEALFRDVSGHDQLLGNEDVITSTLIQRLPSGLPSIRTVEIAAVHVVGEPSTVPRRRNSSLLPAPLLGGDGQPMGPLYPPNSPVPGPSSVAPPPLSAQLPPPPSGPYAVAPPSGAYAPSPPSNANIPPPPTSRRRTTSSSIRAVSASLVPPRGALPAEVGVALSPLLRDATTRLLLGFLRTHDLVIVRGVTLDETATEFLAALLPVSEVAPGEFESSRWVEIGKWRSTLGGDVLDALRAEAAILAVHLANLSMQRIAIVPEVAIELLDSLCRTAFPADEGGYVRQTGRYVERDMAAEAARTVADVLGHPSADPLALAAAPLLDAVSSDMDVMVQIAKVSLGLS